MCAEFRLWLVRHGQTPWNASGRCIGRTDLHLNQFGRETVKVLKEYIDIEACDAIYCSPSNRAIETAQILTHGHSQSVIISKALREIDFGSWEGETWQNINKNHEMEWNTWKQDPVHSAPYGGESLEDVARRMAQLYRVFQESHAGQTILVVGHGGCLNIFLCTLFQIPLNVLWTFRLNPASFSDVVVSPQGPILVALNLVPHLNIKKHSIIPYGKSDEVESILHVINKMPFCSALTPKQ